MNHIAFKMNEDPLLNLKNTTNRKIMDGRVCSTSRQVKRTRKLLCSKQTASRNYRKCTEMT